MEKANAALRKMIEEDANLTCWHVAQQAGWSDFHFCSKLRRPLKEEERKKVLDAIQQLQV